MRQESHIFVSCAFPCSIIAVIVFFSL